MEMILVLLDSLILLLLSNTNHIYISLCLCGLSQVLRSVVLLLVTSPGDRRLMWTLTVGQPCIHKLCPCGCTRYTHMPRVGRPTHNVKKPQLP